MKDFSALEAKLGVTFNDKKLLEQSVVHRSYINEHPDFETGHNERLEFLGDAVLELAVTEYIYMHYPNPEGDLTNWRAALVNAVMLSEIASELAIEDVLYLSRGEAKDAGTKARQFILANAFEAVVGAMYLDRGFEVCREFIGRVVLARLPNIIENKLYQDPKSTFQEAAQERLGVTPNYHVVSESGPDHARQFVVAVRVADEQIAVGEGSSKQEAQMRAAEKALRIKGW